jgi:hypothetical protein
MPLCHVRYRFYVDQSALKHAGPGVIDAVAEEERGCDDWGEPDALIRRRWIKATNWEGRDFSHDLNRRRYWPRGRLEPIGPVEWVND